MTFKTTQRISYAFLEAPLQRRGALRLGVAAAASGALGVQHSAHAQSAWPSKPVTLLDGLQAGDVIDFSADKVDGQYVVTAVRKLR